MNRLKRLTLFGANNKNAKTAQIVNVLADIFGSAPLPNLQMLNDDLSEVYLCLNETKPVGMIFFTPNQSGSFDINTTGIENSAAEFLHDACEAFFTKRDCHKVKTSIYGDMQTEAHELAEAGFKNCGLFKCEEPTPDGNYRDVAYFEMLHPKLRTASFVDSEDLEEDIIVGGKANVPTKLSAAPVEYETEDGEALVDNEGLKTMRALRQMRMPKHKPVQTVDQEQGLFKVVKESKAGRGGEYTRLELD